MKIYSDTLTHHDLREAAPQGVYMAICEMIQRPRKRHNGWIVSLSGSSPYVSQMSGEKSATWDEHGLWMAELYRRDPDAVIGWYKTREDFIAQTRDERDRVQTHQPEGRCRRSHTAPWLTEDGYELAAA